VASFKGRESTIMAEGRAAAAPAQFFRRLVGPLPRNQLERDPFNGLPRGKPTSQVESPALIQ
jgi:hypothetical protein